MVPPSRRYLLAFGASWSGCAYPIAFADRVRHTTADRTAAHRKLDRRRVCFCANRLRRCGLRRSRFISAKRVHRPDDRAHQTQSKIWSQNVEPRFQTSAAV